jgi:manganese transport protein
MRFLRRLFRTEHKPRFGALEILKYIGPGFLVTVGFIDPGNWASNLVAGSDFGYRLLWMVTLSTLMLMLLQHNVAHLGIVTGRCLSEGINGHFRRPVAKAVLLSAVAAAVSTALAEVLGGAIGLWMLFHIPLRLGAALTVLFACWMLFSNSYRKLERWIIAFVSLIGLSFVFELVLVHMHWAQALVGWVMPSTPPRSMPIVMSVLGAVVMPHNLFLHSEIIQSRQWHLEDEQVIHKQLRYEFLDTLLSMCVGWAINSAMILVAAGTFFFAHQHVSSLPQAQLMLRPLLGSAAAAVFALALLFSGLSSSVTAGMAGGSIFAGMFGEPYDSKDGHTRWGILITYVGALFLIFLVHDPLRGLLISQMLLSIQLPWTIVTQISLTSSRKVMGRFANTGVERLCLWVVAGVVVALNALLLLSYLRAN